MGPTQAGTALHSEGSVAAKKSPSAENLQRERSRLWLKTSRKGSGAQNFYKHNLYKVLVHSNTSEEASYKSQQKSDTSEVIQAMKSCKESVFVEATPAKERSKRSFTSGKTSSATTERSRDHFLALGGSRGHFIAHGGSRGHFFALGCNVSRPGWTVYRSYGGSDSYSVMVHI